MKILLRKKQVIVWRIGETIERTVKTVYRQKKVAAYIEQASKQIK